MTSPTLSTAYAPPDGLLIYDVPDADAWRALVAEYRARGLWADDVELAWRHAREERFETPGHCLVCEDDVALWTTWDHASAFHHGVRLPYWREYLVCPRCGLNNRQRAVAWLTLRAICAVLAEERLPEVYAMEQVTAFHAWFRANLAKLPFVGSEYLGPDRVPGETVGGLRHEDVNALSFADESLDVVVSNDVFEHVFTPERAIAEVARVLRPGGRLLLSVPLDLAAERNVTRARFGPGGIEHQLPPVYHGDPLSADGCLVVTDFGWELIEQCRSAGLRDTMLRAFVGPGFGHRGTQVLIIDGTKS